MIEDKQTKIRLIILLLVVMVSGLLLYRPAVMDTIREVLHRKGSSHGIFVPFLSGYFLWIHRETIWKAKPRFGYFGILILAIGLFLGIADIGEYQLRFIGFIFFITGLIAFILGKDVFKETAFPLFFLIAMVPIPVDEYDILANFLRDITLEGAIRIIAIIGIPYFRDGIMVQLPNALLKVNLGCSGIRYLLSFIVFGTAYAYLFRKSIISRLFIITLTIPISIAASIGRLMSIFLLTYFFGQRMAERGPHILISWIVFFIILISCLAADHFFYQENKKLKVQPNH